MLQRRQCREEKETNTQIKTHETDVAWHEANIDLTNMNVKLFSWTFTFRKVVR